LVDFYLTKRIIQSNSINNTPILALVKIQLKRFINQVSKEIYSEFIISKDLSESVKNKESDI